VLRTVVLFCAIATLFAATDLVHKSVAGAEYFHARSLGYVLVVLVLATAWTAAILATRSLPMALGGAVVAGGAAGNVLSLALWPGVPNPIEVGAIAFNLADIFVLAGFLLVVVVTLALVSRDRERLSQPLRLR
jgi:lipoprotein signal peptidase